MQISYRSLKEHQRDKSLVTDLCTVHLGPISPAVRRPQPRILQLKILLVLRRLRLKYLRSRYCMLTKEDICNNLEGLYTVYPFENPQLIFWNYKLFAKRMLGIYWKHLLCPSESFYTICEGPSAFSSFHDLGVHSRRLYKSNTTYPKDDLGF